MEYLFLLIVGWGLFTAGHYIGYLKRSTDPAVRWMPPKEDR